MFDEEQLGEDKDNVDLIINRIQLKPQHVNSNQTSDPDLALMTELLHTYKTRPANTEFENAEERVYKNNGHVWNWSITLYTEKIWTNTTEFFVNTLYPRPIENFSSKIVTTLLLADILVLRKRWSEKSTNTTGTNSLTMLNVIAKNA